MNEELEARLGSILSDPQQMEKIKAMAQSLMGAAPQSEGENTEKTPTPSGGLGALMGLLGQKGGDGRRSESEALLRAMQPYMRPQRRSKIERALRLTRLIGIAGTMLEQYGGELDGL